MRNMQLGKLAEVEARVFKRPVIQAACIVSTRDAYLVEAVPKSGSGKVMWRSLQEAEAAKG